jgi:hypothetical protein
MPGLATTPAPFPIHTQTGDHALLTKHKMMQTRSVTFSQSRVGDRDPRTPEFLMSTEAHHFYIQEGVSRPSAFCYKSVLVLGHFSRLHELQLEVRVFQTTSPNTTPLSP